MSMSVTFALCAKPAVRRLIPSRDSLAAHLMRIELRHVQAVLRQFCAEDEAHDAPDDCHDAQRCVQVEPGWRKLLQWSN